MYLPVEPGRLIGGRKIEDALYSYRADAEVKFYKYRFPILFL